MHAANHNLRRACGRQWRPGRTRLGVVVLAAVHDFSNLAVYCRLHLPLRRAAWMRALVVAPGELAAFHLLLPVFPPVVAIK